MQTLYGLSGENYMKVTTARWFTPVGRSIQKDHDPDRAMERLVATAVSISGEPVTVAAEDAEPREAYETDGGRTVYGGGGITPDIDVRSDTLTTGEQELRRVAMRDGVVVRDAVFRWMDRCGRRWTSCDGRTHRRPCSPSRNARPRAGQP